MLSLRARPFAFQGGCMITHPDVASWPSSTGILCHFCCCPIKSTPWTIPVSFNANSRFYVCHGMTCSPECSKALILENSYNNSNLQLYLLQAMMRNSGISGHGRICTPRMDIEAKQLTPRCWYCLRYDINFPVNRTCSQSCEQGWRTFRKGNFAAPLYDAIFDHTPVPHYAMFDIFGGTHDVSAFRNRVKQDLAPRWVQGEAQDVKACNQNPNYIEMVAAPKVIHIRNQQKPSLFQECLTAIKVTQQSQSTRRRLLEGRPGLQPPPPPKRFKKISVK